jgi:hypothetical protein
VGFVVDKMVLGRFLQVFQFTLPVFLLLVLHIVDHPIVGAVES